VILATADDTSRFELDPAVLDERDVATASAETDESSGRWMIAIHLTPSGTEALSRSTADHLHGKLAWVVGGVVVSVPVVESRISSGQVALVAVDHAAAVALADALGGTSS
jgi:preprotein translocase subunit SecD